MTPPVLTTDRLILREIRRSDFDAYADFYASDRTAFIGGPQDAAGAWRRFASDVGHWVLMGFGWWTVEKDGAPVGGVGLHHPPHQSDVELGWNLYAGADGQGFAAESARAVLSWARATLLPGTPVVSYIDTENAASIRLAERLGARRQPGRAAHDPDAYTYLHSETAP